MKVTALRGRVQRVYVPVPGTSEEEPEKIWVDFKPGMFTLEIAEKINEAGADTTAMVNLLEPLLVAWDIEDEVLDNYGNPTGEVRQLTTKAADIKKVPVIFLSAMIDLMTGNMRPPPASGDNSAGSSQPTGSLVPFPSGTASAEQQSG